MRSKGAMRVFACRWKNGQHNPNNICLLFNEAEYIQHNRQHLQQAHCEPCNPMIVSTFSAAEAQYSRHLSHIFSDLVLLLVMWIVMAVV